MHLNELITTLGYAGIFLAVFAESGLFIGFFLPGDSMLFSAGLLAATRPQDFNIWVLAIGCFIAAVAGDTVGYWFGRKYGQKLFTKEDSIFFHKKNLHKAQSFYAEHGRKTIILARFIPVVRTFAPIVAGIGEMHYKTFLAFNIIGGIIWGVGVTVAGYFLGKVIPVEEVDKYLIPIVLLIIVVSVAPALWHMFKEKESRDEFRNFLGKTARHYHGKLTGKHKKAS
jgi:membrane-associated protein